MSKLNNNIMIIILYLSFMLLRILWHCRASPVGRRVMSFLTSAVICWSLTCRSVVSGDW